MSSYCKTAYLPVICECGCNHHLPPISCTMEFESGQTTDPLVFEHLPFPTVSMCHGELCEDLCSINSGEDEDIKVTTEDGYVIVEGQYKEKSKIGWIDRHVLRECPLPPGFKPKCLLTNYMGDGTLVVTAGLGKCEETKVQIEEKDNKTVPKPGLCGIYPKKLIRSLKMLINGTPAAEKIAEPAKIISWT